MRLKQNEATAARRRVLIALNATGITIAAGDLKVSKNGASAVNAAGTWTEIGSNVYSYEFTAGEVDTTGYVAAIYLKAGVFGSALAQVVPADPYDPAVLSESIDALVAALGLGKRVLFVTPAGGSDSNSGLMRLGNAKATLASVNTAAQAGDTIVVLPDLTGGTARFTVSSSLNLKDNTTWLGCGANMSRMQLTGSAVLNLPTRLRMLGGMEIDATASTAVNGCLLRSAVGDSSSWLEFERLKVVAKLQVFQLSAASAGNRVLMRDCDLTGGLNAVSLQGAATNVLRVVNSRLGADNSLNANEGDVAALFCSGGQIELEDSDLQSVSWSDTAERLDGLYVPSTSLSYVRMSGGSINLVQVDQDPGHPDPIHRVVRASGTICRVHLGAVNCSSDPALIEATGGAVIERLSAGSDAQAIWDLFAGQVVGKKPDGTDLTWREAQVYLPAFVAASHRRTSQGKTEILSCDGSQVAGVGSASLDARTLESLGEIYPLDQ